MTRRLVLTMVSVAAATLVVATVAALLVFRVQGRAEARKDLRTEAVTLAARLDAVEAPAALNAVMRALRLEGANVLRLGANGRLTGQPPPGLTLDQLDLDVASLESGETKTGIIGDLAFAAAPAPTFDSGGGRPTGPLLVLVLTRELGGVGPVASPWFLVALVATLAFATTVAVNLSRRLTRPLRQAEDATRRIAAGDLAARVPVSVDDGAELAGLARSVNAMAASLERSRGLERQFLLAVSHDLRTPLTSIRGFAEAIKDGRVADPVHAAEVIGSESRRLERLVADLLELAKLDARRFSLDVRSTDLAEVTAVTVEGFQPAADEAGVVLTLDSTPVHAAADPDRLAQVLANLIENALKFASTQVQVGTRSAGGAAVLWVDDDGPGIPAEDLSRVFEPFFRSARTAHRQLGSGLGLAIVSELVTAMGGTARAEAQPGGSGARMVVTLREWQVAHGAGDGPPRPPAGPGVGAGRARRARG